MPHEMIEIICGPLADRIAQNYEQPPVGECSERVILYVTFRLQKNGRIRIEQAGAVSGTQVKLPGDLQKTLVNELMKAVTRTEPFTYMNGSVFDDNWYRVQVKLQPQDNSFSVRIIDPRP